jgi:hypothetical protein
MSSAMFSPPLQFPRSHQIASSCNDRLRLGPAEGVIETDCVITMLISGAARQLQECPMVNLLRASNIDA